MTCRRPAVEAVVAVHEAGHVVAQFSEAMAVIGAVERKAH